MAVEDRLLEKMKEPTDWVKGWNAAIETVAKCIERERGDRYEMAARRARSIRDLKLDQ